MSFIRHAPSWQIFATTTYSPHQPNAYNREEFFYLFDLHNRYNRHWFYYDFTNGNMDMQFTYDDVTSDKTDTLVLNLNTEWNDPEYGVGAVNPIDGLIFSTRHNMRNLYFQKTNISKNNIDLKINKSEYYEYERRFQMDPIVIEYQVEPIVFTPCLPWPTNEPIDCDDCIYYKDINPSIVPALTPLGFCAWKISGTGGIDSYMICPENFDYSLCPDMAGAINVHCWNDVEDDNSPIGSGMTTQNGDSTNTNNGEGPLEKELYGEVLKNSLLLKNVIVQIDTLPSTKMLTVYNSQHVTFDQYKFDSKNKYITEFYASKDMDADNFLVNTNRNLYPFDTLLVSKLLKINRYTQPEIVQNQVGLKTKYYYDSPQYFQYTDINCSNGTFTTVINKNIGQPNRVDVGYDNPNFSPISRYFEYYRDGQLKKVTEASGKFMEYEYDEFWRLKQVKENGTRILSESEYHLWDSTSSILNFKQKTAENYVKSKTYNSASSFYSTQGFLDPLGRAHSTKTTYLDGSSPVVVYSGNVVLDELGRTIRQHKGSLTTGSILGISDNLSTAYVTNVYESNPKSRVLKSSNYGVSIADVHTVRHRYDIANYVYASCELGLSLDEFYLVMGHDNSKWSSHRYRRNETRDQDDKIKVSYTNAMGQKLADLSYSSASEKIVTLYFYDSYGNLNKVINPKKQNQDFRYNILGQLIIENTIDAGTKKYMYNKHGLVSAIYDQVSKNWVDNSGLKSPMARAFKYDQFGRQTEVARVVLKCQANRADGVGSDLNSFLYENREIIEDYNYYPTPNTSAQPAFATFEYFKYVFSNISTLDWMASFTTYMPAAPGYQIITYPISTELDPTSFYSSWNINTLDTLEKQFTYELFSPNAIGKLTQEKSFDNHGIDIQHVTYTYDNFDNLASQHTRFHPTLSLSLSTTLPEVESHIEYPAYDYAHRLLSETADVDNDGSVDITYFNKYDNLGRLESIYAANGLATSANQGTKIASYEYDPVTNLLITKNNYVSTDGGTDFNTNRTNYSYDVRDRLTNIDAQIAINANPDFKTFWNYKLFYDNQLVQTVGGQKVSAHKNYNGNINGVCIDYDMGLSSIMSIGSITEFLSTSTLHGFKYDQLNRLTNFNSNALSIGDSLVGDEYYTYDKIGNITAASRKLMANANNPDIDIHGMQDLYYYYSGNNNRLSMVKNASVGMVWDYTYDENANVMQNSHRNVDFSEYGRGAYPFAVGKTNDWQLNYLYDAKDMRIYKQKTDETSYYLYDAAGHQIAVRNTKMTPTGLETSWQYFIFGKEREAKLIKSPYNTTTYFTPGGVEFYVSDHLGNTRVTHTPLVVAPLSAVDPVQTNIQYIAEYLAYGKILREYVADKPRYLTTQHERDAETGLDYRGARFYDADVARFLSLDPLANKYPSWSAYNYVMGNPVRLVDEDGKAPGEPEKKSDPAKVTAGYYGVRRTQFGNGTPVKLNTDFDYITPSTGTRFSPDEPSSFFHADYSFADNNKNVDVSVGGFRNHTKGDFLFAGSDDVHWSVGNSQIGAGVGIEASTNSIQSGILKGASASISVFGGAGPQFSKFTSGENSVSTGGWGIQGFGATAAGSLSLNSPKFGGFSASLSVDGVLHHAKFKDFSVTNTSSGVKTEHSNVKFSTSGYSPTLKLKYNF